MKKIFVDTNFFLRFLLKDVQKQHLKTKKLLLEGAKGKVALFTSLVVVFELYWVLTSFYRKNRKKVIKTILEILKLEFIELEERETLLKALKIYSKSNLDFEDSYNLIYALTKNAEEIATFDKKLEKIFKKERE
ncbi:MAG: PIN domain-containing protein [Microgenomates group bacterium]